MDVPGPEGSCCAAFPLEREMGGKAPLEDGTEPRGIMFSFLNLLLLLNDAKKGSDGSDGWKRNEIGETKFPFFKKDLVIPI